MDLIDFDLNLLMTFDAIYRHHNLSAAAIELGMTQPAVSAALKRMRACFDNPLFVRTSHGMRPTPSADGVSVNSVGRWIFCVKLTSPPLSRH